MGPVKGLAAFRPVFCDVVDAVRHTLAAGDWPDAARLLADHLFSLTLDGQEGTIAALLRSFPAGASVDHPELALGHAAVELAQGRMEDAAVQLALAESHVQSVPMARRPRLAVAVASLRLVLARRRGQFVCGLEFLQARRRYLPKKPARQRTRSGGRGPAPRAMEAISGQD